MRRITVITLLIIITGAAYARIGNNDMERLIKIHDELVFVENLIIQSAGESRSDSLGSAVQTDIRFDYAKLLAHVQTQRAGITSHINILNKAPKWYRFNLQ